MSAWSYLSFFVGLVVLVVGAEVLVRGASRLAIAIGITPLVVGLTVVAFGTSSPELAISLQATLAGNGDLAFGNVVGSNILNILVILGLAALIAPLVVTPQVVRREVPAMVGICGMAFALALDGRIEQVEGLILLVVGVAYVSWTVVASRRESREVAERYERRLARPSKRLLDVVFVVGGLGMLAIGSRWLMRGAIDFATWAGVSELVIGLTIVAGGTSMPEVATSAIASLRGERDIAIGNAIGSTIFNIALVLAVTAIVAPGGIVAPPGVLGFDLPVMLAAAVACLPILSSHNRINRWEGALFVAYYLAYATYVVLDATEHHARAPFTALMLGYVVPLTALGMGGIIIGRLYRKR